MIDNKDFHSLCDELEKSIELLDSDSFRVDSPTVLNVGNKLWVTSLFCLDESLENPSWPLLDLMRSRRDLLYPVVKAVRFREYLRASHELAVWLNYRGYGASLGAKTVLGTFKLFLFNILVSVFNVFSPSTGGDGR